MTVRIRSIVAIGLCYGLALFAAGCASAPVSSLSADLTPAEIFQRAQDASDKADYSTALQYYKLFQDKFPDDRERQAWASYEVAFIYHKMGDSKKALVMLDDLLARYAKGEKLPEAPRILAEKVKARIEADLKLPTP
jgi:outer membrane protein assembly factor BamD (BamD/ComL family)